MSLHRTRLCALLFVLVCTGSVPADEAWRAGAAKINITPDKLIWMSGYGNRDHPAEGKLTDLWAKALVLDDAAGQRGVLITLDLVGIGRKLSLTICDSLKQQYGLDRRQVAICTSHTHTGPAVGRNLEPLHYLQVDHHQRSLIDQYAETLHRKVIELVGHAIQDLSPSSLAWGNGTATFAVNRRNNSERHVPQLRLAKELKGPFDHDVPVLSIRNSEGQLKSVVFGYACHSTVLSFYQWSGDYPGFAQQELEDSHPGCVALFFAGCGADQNPLPRRTVELAQHYGRRLATAVDAVLLTSEMTPVSSQLKTSYEEIDLALDTIPSRDQIEADARSENRFVAARAKMFLGRMDAGQPLSQTYPYPVGAWQLGEIQFVILGGEVVVDFALRLKAELAGAKTWVAGYANDVMAYIPSRRVLREGGYEGAGAMVYYGLPTPWAPTVENDIVHSARTQLGR